MNDTLGTMARSRNGEHHYRELFVPPVDAASVPD